MRRSLPSIFDDFNTFYDALSPCCQKSNNLDGLSISEDTEKLYIDAPLPGVKSDEVEVTLDQKKRHLLIKGKGNFLREGATYHIKSSQNYFYEIPLSNEVNLDENVEACSKDGILSIALSKSKEVQPLKIMIKTS